MKIKSISWLIACIFVLVLVFTVGSPAAPNGNAPPAAAPSRRSAMPSPRCAAPKDTWNAQRTIFGGHHVEAIRATDAAIRQLEQCLRYDKD